MSKVNSMKTEQHMDDSGKQKIKFILHLNGEDIEFYLCNEDWLDFINGQSVRLLSEINNKG